MSIYNINNEKILDKLRFIVVCDNDDFLSNAFNFLILEDCINIASSYDDLESLKILKTLINPFIKNLINNDIPYEYISKSNLVTVLGFRRNKNDLGEYEKFINFVKDICLNQLSESDQELYQYKFKQLLENKDLYLLAFKELLK